jgi:hypothetical protein
MKTCKKPISEANKWMISLWSGLLFFLIASPFMFKLTGGIFSSAGLQIEKDGCPNLIGVGIHAVVFAILVRLMMLIPENK